MALALTVVYFGVFSSSSLTSCSNSDTPSFSRDCISTGDAKGASHAFEN